MAQTYSSINGIASSFNPDDSTAYPLPSGKEASQALNADKHARQGNGSSAHCNSTTNSYALADSPKNSFGISRLQTPSPTLTSSFSNQSLFFRSPLSIMGSGSCSHIELSDIRLNLICNWLYQKQLQNMWSIGEAGEGVMVRKDRDTYVCCPPELSVCSDGLYNAVKQLNFKCAMTINTRTTRLILELNDSPDVPLSNGQRLQVVESFEHLWKCQKNQPAAFICNPPMLVVWDDDPSHIIERVQDLESQMMNIVWVGQTRISDKETYSTIVEEVNEKNTRTPELGTAAASAMRKAVIIQPCIVAVTFVIMFAALGAGWRNLAIEIRTQRTWGCLAFAATGPLQAWMGLFIFQALPTYLAQIVGPVRQMRQNSRFYSGQPPSRMPGRDLPHVTIQCPVYKENLHTVIQPTIKSIKTAISTYEMQGGSANIFVNDDGLQLLSSDDARERCDFYEEHNIGWVARPRHNAVVSGQKTAFVRAGKFKKASNMNYALNVSIRVEDKLDTACRPGQLVSERRIAYQNALAAVIDEDAGSTWAAGNVRIGDYILLVDSDTRVPRDCLLDAVSELEQCPHVAIVQFSSGVLNVTQSWFEKGITFFTNLVYTAIEFSVANGDVAPFVGHNAFLRWSAMQDIAYSTPDRPLYQHFWSEQTVSEDFDIALRLQTSGYILRHASYANGEFKEGVSLTVYDELARWEKYAFGCSELIFRPFHQWIFKGPLTPLFRRFLLSDIPLHSKISIMAYVGTYFAIASSWLLTLINYFLVGWYNGYLDHYYVDSFKIYFSTVIVFSFAGNVALAIFRYRIKDRSLLDSLVENFKWAPFLAIFLGGISLHVSQAILCHLFSIDMTWGATSKEATDTSFFREVPLILRKFRLTFAFCLVMTTVIICLSGIGPFAHIVPFGWQITEFTAIFPLVMLLALHALLPLALNPGLMQFTF